MTSLDPMAATINGHRGGEHGGNAQSNHGGNQTAQDAGDPSIGALEHEMNPNLPERFRNPRNSFQPVSGRGSEAKLKIKLNKNIRAYFEAEEKIRNQPEEWMNLSEIPAPEEVSLEAGVDIVLPPNKQKGKWKNSNKYLKAQYTLLREDAVSPLREAVDTFRRNPSMFDDTSVSIYEKVFVVGFTFAQLGIAARIRFSTNRAQRRILWRSSKRLVSGSIVALTPANDNFKDKCIIALVAARPLERIDAPIPELDIYFSRTQDIQLDPQQEWIMIEARQGYYESNRHTLRALQKLSQECFPLSEHICSLNTDVSAPAYLSENPIVDLSVTAHDEHDSNRCNVNVINNWPNSPPGSLDETQWAAIQDIITRKFAIIQGPPGTGKTYVSKIALEVLSSYFTKDDSPIIVAAQTNHALDQLLGHISTFEPDYIRLGGRSTNPEVKKRALFEIRKMERFPSIPGGGLTKAYTQWNLQSKALAQLLEPFHQEHPRPFSIDMFHKHGVITSEQYESMTKEAARWVSSEGENDVLQLWLSKSLIPFKVDYESKVFNTDEDDDDLEIEQLREQEAEHGVADEEDAELLRGIYCPVEDYFTVRPPNETDLIKAEGFLDGSQDLWNVPRAYRGPIYAIMQHRLKQSILKKFREHADIYEKTIRDLKIGKWERDSVYLQRAKVIGLTTTGLSKYRALIASLKPKVILIEEAAEVIEAPITVACMESLEHLILVGDHQQLQGHCSVSDLEGDPYYLNVSLFERMVRNKMPFKTLLRQRRMEPEFRELISSLYPGLKDHSSVMERSPLSWGMGKMKSYFLTHDWSEYQDSQMSKYNEEEAIFVAGFYRYLIRNGMSPSSITILTFYNGQRKKLLKEISKFPELSAIYHKVKTVDSYQGEENEIVILSLVRSNSYDSIGFLGISNRVCVALSRARAGFYLFGNSNLLARSNPLWETVVHLMTSQPCRLGHTLPLRCEKHDNAVEIQYPDDWTNNDGGCSELCVSKLPCGHVCPLKCHAFPHSEVLCHAVCGTQLNCGHSCGNECSKVCSCDCAAFSQERSFYSDPSEEYGRALDQPYPDISSNNPTENAWTNWPAQMSTTLEHTTNRNSQRQTTKQGSAKASGQFVNQNVSDDPFIDRDGQNSAMSKTSTARSVTSAQARETMSRNLLTPEKQSARLGSWNQFAGGGVMQDDRTKALVAATEREKKLTETTNEENLLVELSPSQECTPVKSEVSQKLADGRTKFTQEYQMPSARMSPEKGNKSSRKKKIESKSLLD